MEVHPTSRHTLAPTPAVSDSAMPIAAAIGESGGSREVRRASSVAWWPGAAWALAAVALLARTAWARVMLLRFRTGRLPVDDAEVCRSVADLAERLGIRRPIAVLQAAGLSAPVAFGLWKPTVVLPAAFLTDFDRRQQRVMLAHELAHLAGRDPFWLFLADLACAALWWHPAAWWLRGRLRSASEAAADEASVLVPGGPDLLAGCLVRLGRRVLQPRRLGWLSVAGGGFRSALGRRVERLLRLPETPDRPPRRQLIVFLAAVPWLLIVICVLSTAWARPQAAFSEGESTMRVIHVSWQRSLAAIALAAFLGPAAPSAVAQDRPHEPRAVAPKDEGPPKHRPEGEKPKPRHEEGDREGPPDGPPKPELGPHQRELLQMREKLFAKAREIEQKLRSAPQDSDDARELRENLMRVKQELERVINQLPPPLRGRPEMRREGQPGGPERQQIEQKLEELQRKFRELREAGKGDEAERVGREIREIRARLGAMREGRPMGKPDMPPEERQRRMQHLRAAAENLRAAGMPELAERILRQGEPFGPPGEGRPRPEGPRPEGPRGEFGRPEGPRPEGIEPVMREMMNQMQELRRQVQELRDEVRKMKGERPR